MMYGKRFICCYHLFLQQSLLVARAWSLNWPTYRDRWFDSPRQPLLPPIVRRMPPTPWHHQQRPWHHQQSAMAFFYFGRWIDLSLADVRHMVSLMHKHCRSIGHAAFRCNFARSLHAAGWRRKLRRIALWLGIMAKKVNIIQSVKS